LIVDDEQYFLYCDICGWDDDDMPFSHNFPQDILQIVLRASGVLLLVPLCKKMATTHLSTLLRRSRYVSRQINSQSFSTNTKKKADPTGMDVGAWSWQWKVEKY
jgi:hypothetical protein